MTTTRVAPQAALAGATYYKSTRSTSTGNCVAIGYAGDWVGVQDTKQGPYSTTLAFPAATFAAFLVAVKADALR